MRLEKHYDRLLHKYLALMTLYPTLVITIQMRYDDEDDYLKKPVSYRIAASLGEDRVYEIEKLYGNGGFTMEFSRRPIDWIRKVPLGSIKRMRLIDDEELLLFEGRTLCV